MRLILLIILLGLNCQMLQADQLQLIINGKSIHLGAPKSVSLNETNWGLGLQYDYSLNNKKWIPFISVSGFSDSFNKPSYYAGGGIMRRYVMAKIHDDNVHFDIGLFAFMMSRDDFYNRKPFPGILPAFSIGTDKIAVNMTYIPKIAPKLIPLWFFQLKIAI